MAGLRVHLPGARLFGLEERHFFPSLFPVWTILYCHKSSCHICSRSQPHRDSLDAHPGILPASRLPQQFMAPGGCSPARNLFSPPAGMAEGTGGICSPFILSPETALVMVWQGRGMLSRSIDIVIPDVSQRSLSPSTAGKQRSRFAGGVHTPKAIMLKKINK